MIVTADRPAYSEHGVYKLLVNFRPVPDYLLRSRSPMRHFVSAASIVNTAACAAETYRRSYRAVKYRHFRNDSLSISGASSARCTLAQL